MPILLHSWLAHHIVHPHISHKFAAPNQNMVTIQAIVIQQVKIVTKATFWGTGANCNNPHLLLPKESSERSAEKTMYSEKACKGSNMIFILQHYTVLSRVRKRVNFHTPIYYHTTAYTHKNTQTRCTMHQNVCSYHTSRL